ncbi:MAG TPA: DUF72 domain-containing protein [Rudaea sp.]|jgi:uncharacterized protein YecE (DUF72 family)
MASRSKRSSASASGQIRVGIGGWNFAPWRNNFYPEKWPQKRELEYASGKLTAIEVNSTFYRPQTAATYANWRSQTPDGFVFSLKAPGYATQTTSLENAAKAVKRFVFAGLAELGDRLGPISWQFASNRAFARDYFTAFLDLLPHELNGYPLRHVLEVRHQSFMCSEYLDLTREHRMPSVFTDSTEYPSFADLTGDFVYARLMRSESSQPTGYSSASLAAWVERASAWARGDQPGDLTLVEPAAATPAQARDVYIYFISAAKERNPAAALALIERLGR